MSIVANQEIIRAMEEKLSSVLTVDAMRTTLEALDATLVLYDINRVEFDDTEHDYLLEAYFDAITSQGLSPKTIKQYRYILTKFLNSTGVSSRNVSPYHVRRYFTAEKERGISDRTLANQRSIFCNYFNWLHRDGLITKNPMVNIGPIKYEQRLKEVFSECDLEKIKMGCATLRDKALVCFLKASGCRVGEVEALTRDSVDLVRRCCIVHGKGNKWRKVYIDAVTAMILGEYLDSRTDDNPSLFVTLRGAKTLHQNGIRVMLKQLSARTGVAHIHPHKFRRTEFTYLHKKGMAPEEIKVIAGHSSLDTTLSYVIINDEQISASYNKYA